VIPARVTSIDGCGGEASDAVGFEPFTTKRGTQVGANFWSEVNHDALSIDTTAAARETRNVGIFPGSSI
jgi:hypothetical protein